VLSSTIPQKSATLLVDTPFTERLAEALYTSPDFEVNGKLILKYPVGELTLKTDKYPCTWTISPTFMYDNSSCAVFSVTVPLPLAVIAVS